MLKGCPYEAIRYLEDKKICEINEVICKGCGPAANLSIGQLPAQTIHQQADFNTQIDKPWRLEPLTLPSPLRGEGWVRGVLII